MGEVQVSTEPEAQVTEWVAFGLDCKSLLLDQVWGI
jgi:hypothetical protein